MGMIVALSVHPYVLIVLLRKAWIEPWKLDNREIMVALSVRPYVLTVLLRKEWIE